MVMKDFNLSNIIKMCGGQTVVARHLNVHRKTIHQWERNGFPRTEWTGETDYAERIQKLCKVNGIKITATQIINNSL